MMDIIDWNISDLQFETFDLRTGVSPTFVSPPLFDAAELFDGIEVEVSTDRQIIGAGWEDDVRKIKLLDVRTGGIITSAVVLFFMSDLSDRMAAAKGSRRFPE